MEKSVIEHSKERSIILDTGYMYQELIKDENTQEYGELFSMSKEGDYSFLYTNFNMEAKERISLNIEADSLFIEPFKNLVGDDQEFRIDDDYSERFIRMIKDENGGVVIEIHLLPSEYDASIELKNIMFDLRSEVDREGKDTKKRLSNFFSELVKVYEKMPDLSNQKLMQKKPEDI